MLIALLMEEMKEHFEMHDLGESSLYLGMNIEREKVKQVHLQHHHSELVRCPTSHIIYNGSKESTLIPEDYYRISNLL